MRASFGRLLTAVILVCGFGLYGSAETPGLHGKAPDFALSTPEGQPVALSGLLKQGPVALVFLRGFPGYQCPFCMRQVHDLEQDSAKFAAKGVQLLLVYPGLAEQLDDHAKEFLGKQEALPANFHLVVDVSAGQKGHGAVVEDQPGAWRPGDDRGDSWGVAVASAYRRWSLLDFVAHDAA